MMYTDDRLGNIMKYQPKNNMTLVSSVSLQLPPENGILGHICQYLEHWIHVMQHIQEILLPKQSESLKKF